MNYRFFFKRILDVLISLGLFLVLFPIFVLIAITLIIHHRGNPFFGQARPGLAGKPFHILKFKTMRDKYCEEGRLLSDELRITALGKVIRKTSLDEIPQLINVLRGDMSLVGPRPLLEDYLPLYSQEQSRRHEVKPGVTGWAQINGRNAISWEKKFQLDVWYVDNLSLWIDLKILFRTFFNVLMGKGVSQKGEVSMKRFTGRSVA
ncbi:sugar transferase [Algoriphagus marinus]|uniref:sugar transferase n=1 Tax=Algoriphagus marinus TaxID=1925762 RepID=UPI00094BA2E6|nr:sugar transferase [Algoriphagus marinus]